MKFQIYGAKDGFRWRAIARNGNIVAESGEAYATKFNAGRALGSFLAAADIKTSRVTIETVKGKGGKR